MSAIQIHVEFINIKQRVMFPHAAGKKKTQTLKHSVLKILLLLVNEILKSVCQKPSLNLRSFPIH